MWAWGLPGSNQKIESLQGAVEAGSDPIKKVYCLYLLLLEIDSNICKEWVKNESIKSNVSLYQESTKLPSLNYVNVQNDILGEKKSTLSKIDKENL